MATPHPEAVNSDTPITVKLSIDGTNRKFKIPLRDVAPAVFATKLKSILNIPAEKQLFLERFSDSSNSYNVLDPANPPSYKQLFRAAKAKLKLRLRAVVIDMDESKPTSPIPAVTALLPSHNTGPTPTPAADELESHAAQPSAKKHYKVVKLGGEPSSITQPLKNAVAAWQVCCNHCDKAMPNEHYHCGTCDDGDYDLCVECVREKGIVCPGDDHWLIKRSIRNGQVVNSTTERLAPRKRVAAPIEQRVSIPGAFNPAHEVSVSPAPTLVRTCNSCVTQMAETRLLNCKNCPDFDICAPCLKSSEHGHHPGHSFQPIGDASHGPDVLRLCPAGQLKSHAAICDGCDKSIYGVRHKCLDCPDWDFCQACHTSSEKTHPGHRFVPLYDCIKGSLPLKVHHYGIYCDGPLCARSTKQSYIRGARYKCAICHDTDFCANCEAHPGNQHNKSHPLIKFHTAVGNATISTFGEDPTGRAMPLMGDRTAAGTTRTTGAAALSALASAAPTVKKEAAPPVNVQPVAAASPTFDAHFVRETIVDGTELSPGAVLEQSWTLRNPGPFAWPAGVAVYSTGGDRMINIDPAFSASVASILKASRSNETTRAILPGEEFTFTVKLRTPLHAGKQISYWRAKLRTGECFGHKLWCDVEVKQPVAEKRVTSVASQPVSAKTTDTVRKSAALPNIPIRTLKKEDHTAAPREYPRDNQVSTQRPEQYFYPFPRYLQDNVAEGAAESHRPSTPFMTPSPAAFDNPRQAPRPVRVTMAESDAICHSIPVTRYAEPVSSITVKSADAVEAPAAAPVPPPKIESAPLPPFGQVSTEQKGFSVASKEDNNLEGSQMVFPTLEKESPSSSVHRELSQEPTTEILASAPASVTKPSSTSTESEAKPAPIKVEDDAAQDFASVEYEESDSDDEMFLTDEEYDILDASDEEIMSVGGRHA